MHASANVVTSLQPFSQTNIASQPCGSSSSGLMRGHSLQSENHSRGRRRTIRRRSVMEVSFGSMHERMRTSVRTVTHLQTIRRSSPARLSWWPSNMEMSVPLEIRESEAIMFLLHRRRPALERMVRNSNARSVTTTAADRSVASTSFGQPDADAAGHAVMRTQASTLESLMDRIHEIPPSAMSRLSGSPTVYAR